MFTRIVLITILITSFSKGYSQCNQTTNLSAVVTSQSCPSGTVTYQLTFSSSVPNGNNSICYGYTITSPGGGQQTANIGPVNQSNSTNSNWSHTFAVTINCNQGLTLFMNAWSNLNCGGMLCSSPRTQTLVLAPLPVDLVHFSARKVKEGVHFHWSTAAEVNNAGFYIEYSANMEDWEDIAFIKGQGNSTIQSDYQHFYKTSTPGLHYFRLRQVDFDGAIHYSDWTKTNLEGDKIFLKSTVVQDILEIKSMVGQNITMMNQQGQILQVVKAVEGILYLDVSGLNSGMYFLKPENGENKKFVKW